MQRSNTVNPPQVHAAHVQAEEGGSNRQASKRHKPTPLRVPLIALTTAIVALLTLPLAYTAAHDGKVYQGVRVGDLDLGGMSSEQARNAISTAFAGYPSDTATLSASGREWAFSPADLGVGVDADRTLEAALNIGRSGSFVTDLGRQLGTLFGGAHVEPVLKSDPTLVDNVVAQVAAALDRSAVDSKLEQLPDGTVRVTPSSPGTLVDREATRSALTLALSSVPFAPAQVTMREAAPNVTEDALRSVEAQALLLTGQPVTLKADERTWTIAPDELRGVVELSAPATEGGEWKVGLGNNALALYLRPVANELSVEPKDAAVIIGKGTVTLQPDESGSDLDVPAAIDGIMLAAAQTDPAARTVELRTKETLAQILTTDLQAVYDKANALVTEGMRLRFREDGYILRGASVTGFIDVVRTQGGPSFRLAVDEDVLRSRIAGVAWNINRNVIDARFRMVNGAPARVAEAKEGFKVDVDSSLQRALTALEGYAGGERLQVDLDVAVTEPALKDADLASINTPDLLGTGQTSYAGSSAERAWNVGLGTRNVDGALIPPGATFSTVETIGDLTLAAGFKMGYGIITTSKGVTTVPSEAGGICQVATTLFHSVFWAGLPVVERNWHSYWIGTYGKPPSGMLGLDATIAPPEKDFRFKNTTGNWILVRAIADGTNVTFKLYGVNPGWTVSKSGPVITNRVTTSQAPVTETSSALPAGKKVMVEHAQDGFNSSITRVVRDAGGNVIDNWTAKSRYVPARNRYLVGTGR